MEEGVLLEVVITQAVGLLDEMLIDLGMVPLIENMECTTLIAGNHIPQKAILKDLSLEVTLMTHIFMVTVRME